MKRARWTLGAWLSAFALGACTVTQADAPAWTQIDTHAVGDRWGQVAVYDAARDRMLMFGGENERGQLSELWSLDLATLGWSQITASPPTPRTDLAGVIDTLRDRFIVFGGRVGLATSIDEVWAFDLVAQRWSPLPSGPSPRHDIPATTDGRHAWIFGGAGALFQSFDDLWEFDFATDTWQQLPEPGDHPIARTSCALAYWNGALYLDGGHDVFQVHRDAWRYDLAAQRWSLLTPTGGAAAGAHFGYAFDPVCTALFLTGGDNLDNMDVAFTDALVVQAPARYARLPASVLPPPRDHASLIFDAMRRRLVVYGGGTLGDGLGTRSDAWVYALSGCP